MNESPEKIWVIRDRYVVDPEKSCERTVPYIRADIVDELVEALEELMYARTDKAEQMAEAALNKARGEK